MSSVPIAGGRFAVTGGAGFVGSHVVDALVQGKAERVVVLDTAEDLENLRGAAASGRVEIVRADLRDEDAVRRVVSDAVGVFHLATLPLGACVEDPVGCARVNVEGTLSLFEEAQRAGVAKIVFSSASSVYGETDAVTDETFPLRPTNLYGVSKVAGERSLAALAAGGGPDWVALRYMNVYGPRQRAGLIPSVLERIRAGVAPVVAGGGSAIFDFVHVADVASANLSAMCAPATGVSLNVGSGEHASVLDIVQRLLRLAGSDLEPAVSGGSPGIGRRGRTEAAERALAWRPAWSLDDGLANLVGGST